MDGRDLEFSNNTFDTVLDKGTLDAIRKDKYHGNILRKVIAQLARVCMDDL